MDFFPNGIVLVGNQYEIRLNTTESGIYPAFIFASQGKS
jgi:hypothetical protein